MKRRRDLVRTLSCLRCFFSLTKKDPNTTKRKRAMEDSYSSSSCSERYCYNLILRWNPQVENYFIKAYGSDHFSRISKALTHPSCYSCILKSTSDAIIQKLLTIIKEEEGANVDASESESEIGRISKCQFPGLEDYVVFYMGSGPHVIDYARPPKEIIVSQKCAEAVLPGSKVLGDGTTIFNWKEFCQDTSLEKAGLYIKSSEQNELSSPTRSIDFNQENCLYSSGICSLAISSSQVDEIEPPTRSKRLATGEDTSVGNMFFLTSAVKKSFEMVMLAVSQKWPVLLYGPAGAGKSALIHKLAQDSRNQVLSIHVDDQIDGKTLMGSYVCTEQPGEFRWQPRSLTQAVQNGFWVVFEDVDKAPSDVQSIMLPLLEGAKSFSNGHGEEITVAESF